MDVSPPLITSLVLLSAYVHGLTRVIVAVVNDVRAKYETKQHFESTAMLFTCLLWGSFRIQRVSSSKIRLNLRV